MSNNKSSTKKIHQINTRENNQEKKSENNNYLPENELKTINGKRCLTKCFDKGKVFFHPIYLLPVRSKYKGVCATNPYYVEDSENDNIGGLQGYDFCRLEDNETYNPPDESTIILLSFTFDPRYFLSYFYGLKSFDQVIQWTLENDNLPTLTIYRIHDCAWKVFGKNIDALTYQVLEYYYEKSKNDWLRYYTDVIQREYSFELIKQTNNKSSEKDQIYQLLLDNFYTYNFFVTCVKKYVYENQNTWEKIQSHYLKLKIYVLNCLIKKLEEAENK